MYVIYNVDTHRIYKEYETERGAKIQFTKLTNSGKLNDRWEVMDKVLFHCIWERKEQVKNLMSGEMVEIRASDVGTCLDPSTERYWSM